MSGQGPIPPDNENLASEDPPSSEVVQNVQRSQPELEDTDTKWKLLLEQQNLNFLALIEALKGPTNQVVYLPEFDSENADMDARAWLATAEMCMAENPLSGAPLMVALSRALKGQASAWLSQISYPGMKWNDFQEAFSARYNNSQTLTVSLLNLLNSKPKEGECLATYAATQINTLMSQWKNNSMEQLAVATVLARITQIEPRANRLAFTKEIDTRMKLHQELQALTYLKRKAIPNIDSGTIAPENKRKFIPSSTFVRCAFCGKPGHHISVCRFKNKENILKLNETETKPAVPSDPKANVTCFNCGSNGHYASRCLQPKKTVTGTPPGAIAERRVNVCAIRAPTGVLDHADGP